MKTMIDCHISSPNPLTHLLHIELKFKIANAKQTSLILPAWRPGRYELAPFVENIQGFAALSQNEALRWEKTRPNIWTVETDGLEELVIRYQYYANKMDAGNSVLDDRQIYINFINCMMYIESQQLNDITITIDIPDNYNTVCSLSKTSHGCYRANGYQQLVDSPILASPDLELMHYHVNDHRFTIAMLGQFPLDKATLISDFEKFTKSQIDVMGGFPADQYDFIVHSLDYKHYHGVEHQNSTVLVLGPNNKSARDDYFSKLMGVASHELFHTWNVTRIRPHEMSPYDFSMETMTKTGFVTEGFTTYYGDWFLKQSGVFDQQAYFKEVDTLLKRHFENYGRHESSLIQSSLNLWVDGYKNLFPSKKVSIYVKGALCALILDLTIMKNSNNQYSLIDVIKRLYERYTYDQGGYTRDEVYKIIREIGGEGMAKLLNTLYETTQDLQPLLKDALSYVGCELTPQFHIDECTSKLGIKVLNNIITEIAPDSHIATQLSVGDELLQCNGKQFNSSSLELKTINKFELKRGPRKIHLDVAMASQTYYDSCKIAIVDDPSSTQKENLNLWLGNNQK